MKLWTQWLQAVYALRPACRRARTFVWMALVLMGMCCRADNAGVTSFVRVLNFGDQAYHRFLHLFHSTSLDLDVLTSCWVRLCLVLFRPFEVNSRLVCLADGIKAPKKSKPLPKALAQDDAVRLVSQGNPARPADSTMQACNRAMFELLYSSGLRVSELCGLDVAHVKDGAHESAGWIDFEGGDVTVFDRCER